MLKTFKVEVLATRRTTGEYIKTTVELKDGEVQNDMQAAAFRDGMVSVFLDDPDMEITGTSCEVG